LRCGFMPIRLARACCAPKRRRSPGWPRCKRCGEIFVRAYGNTPLTNGTWRTRKGYCHTPYITSGEPPDENGAIAGHNQ
jgi:hypothetical protein